MNPTIIITAADSKFFDLVQGTILSIRDKPQGKSVDIGFFDLGCIPEQLEWISSQVNHIVEPNWDYDFPGINTAPSYLRGLLARPFLPNYFPGYEIYIWIDADAWVQDWFAIDLLIEGSRKRSIVIIPEVDRGFLIHYGQMDKLIWKWSYEQYRLCFGEDIAKELYSYPILNAGVFAMRDKSIIWRLWSESLNHALQSTVNLWTDQTALNLTIYQQIDWTEQVELLPAYCNWGGDLPAWDPVSRRLVEPYLPHHPIGILHLTAGNKYTEKFTLKTTQDTDIEMGLRYMSSSKFQHLNRYDYLSNSFKVINLDQYFPNMRVGNLDRCPWPYLRREIPHLWYVDQRNPTIGFVSRDEAHILYNNALQFKGQPALEIGCWMGWSA
ncbi:MAG: hypothetical protein Q6M04_05420, partial [Thermostichus sp. BF3_bins_97]